VAAAEHSAAQAMGNNGGRPGVLSSPLSLPALSLLCLGSSIPFFIDDDRLAGLMGDER
jgi:hypothetical protein